MILRSPPPQTNRAPRSRSSARVCFRVAAVCLHPKMKARLGVEFLWGLVSRDWAGVLLDCLRCVWGCGRSMLHVPVEKVLTVLTFCLLVRKPRAFGRSLTHVPRACRHAIFLPLAVLYLMCVRISDFERLHWTSKKRGRQSRRQLGHTRRRGRRRHSRQANPTAAVSVRTLPQLPLLVPQRVKGRKGNHQGLP